MGHNPCNKVDRALAAYIISSGAGTAADVFVGKRSETKVIPCTIVWAHSARVDENNPYSGRWKVEAFIEIRTNAVQEKPSDANPVPQSAADLSDARVSPTIDAFQFGDGQSSDALSDAINSANVGGSGTIQSIMIVGVEQGFNTKTLTTQGPQPFNVWVDTLHLEITWVPATITP